MKRRRFSLALLLTFAAACVATSAGSTQTDQATVIGELPLSYVPLEATGQTPCPVAATAPAHPERFPNRLLVGDWILSAERGTIRCSFDTTDAGYCTLGKAGHLVISYRGAATAYDISSSPGAELEMRDGRHACRIGRRLRTHGDTIVPNREQ